MTGSQQMAGTVTRAVQPVCIFVMDSSSTLVPPQSTPIKHGTTTMARFTTNHKYRQKEMSDMGDEMRDYIVGPMPTSRFLNEFFPKKSIQSTDKAKVYRPGCFDKVVSCSDEIQAYAPFVRSIHYDHPLTCIHFMLQIKAAAPFAPNLKFVNSSTHVDCSGQTDFSFEIKPDVCAYLKGGRHLGPTDVARAELIIEFKWHLADDPFCDPYIPSGAEHTTIFREGKTCADTLGQITSYAAAQLGSQFRTCIYSVLIVKDKARLIRWDRTGAIVTEAFCYNSNRTLAEFFRRYHKAPPNIRGVDTTVTVPTPDEIRLARECLRFGEHTRYVKMTVPALSLKSVQSYIVAVPKAGPYTPPGRATRGFVAFDLQRGRQVYLKDTWRVDLPGIEKEGETYRLMEEAQVLNISPCSAAGDIKDHCTCTHLYNNKPWACKARKELVPHHNYRLVLDIIGGSLTTFSSSREMLGCIVDALQGR